MRALRLDLLRRLHRSVETVESLRQGDDFDRTLAAARQRGEILRGTTMAGTQTTEVLILAPAARADLDRLVTDGETNFLDGNKDDVGRRFVLSIEDELPDRGDARRLREEAARYRFVRDADARHERAKAAALVGALAAGKLTGLLRQAGEEDAAQTLLLEPLSDPLQYDVIAEIIRDTYAPLLRGAAAQFAVAVADGAAAVHALYGSEGEAREIAEALGHAFAELVIARLAAAGEAFEALTAVETVA